MVNISLIIPTYCEEQNIIQIIEESAQVLEKLGSYEIIIVDDNSPDNTVSLANSLKDKYSLNIIVRTDKRGLSSAIYDGFCNAKGSIVGVIDADLSHPPDKILELVKPVLDGSSDLTIGSRYINDGGVEAWPFIRKLTSLGATFLARLLLSVKDPMSGFFFVKKDLINDLIIDSEGYKILLEYLVKLKKRYHDSLKIKEIPYMFRNRFFGQSKLDGHQYFLFLKDLIRLIKYYYFSK